LFFSLSDIMSNRYTTLLIAFLLIPAFLSLFIAESYAEFYKYLDENGDAHYVDNFDRIPDKFKDSYIAYPEKYDHLPYNDQKKKIDEDRLENERLILEKQRLEDKHIQGMEAEELENKSTPDAGEEKLIGSTISVDRGRALVPVTLGYLGKQVSLTMLLDTGTSTSILNKDIANTLQTTDANEIRLGFIQAGPRH